MTTGWPDFYRLMHGFHLFFYSNCLFGHPFAICLAPNSSGACRTEGRGELPNNAIATLAVRRACQPAGGIEVNKLKCTCNMCHDRLLPEWRGILWPQVYYGFLAGLNPLLFRRPISPSEESLAHSRRTGPVLVHPSRK